MQEQQVKDLTRFWCQIFHNTLHSAMKLLEAPFCWRFKTFTETIISSWSRIPIPLYTRPKLPDSIRLSGENPPVTQQSLLYENFAMRSVIESVDDDFFFDFILQLRARKSEEKMMKKILQTIMTLNLKASDFPSFITIISHACSCNSRIPPQSFLFPFTDMILAFLKMPSVNTPPLQIIKRKIQML